MFRFLNSYLFSPAKQTPTTLRFRPQLEGFEDRVVPHHSSGGVTGVVGSMLPAVNVFSLDVTSVQVMNGELEAVVQVGANSTVNVPLTITTTTTGGTTGGTGGTGGTTGGTTSIQVEASPIQLNLRGTTIDTSAIAMSFTPTTGTTGSFGSVLSSVATALSGGTSLQNVCTSP